MAAYGSQERVQQKALRRHTVYILSMMPYGMEYPFGQLGSAVLAVSPPSFLCTPSLLAVYILSLTSYGMEYPFGQLGSAVLAVSSPNFFCTPSLLAGQEVFRDLLPQPTPRAAQGWRLNHFLGQPVPILDNPFSEEKFPNIQSKPPLAQLEAISSCPITCYLGEETDPHLSTTSFQAKQSQLPQPLLIRLVLQKRQSLSSSLTLVDSTLHTETIERATGEDCKNYCGMCKQIRDEFAKKIRTVLATSSQRLLCWKGCDQQCKVQQWLVTSSIPWGSILGPTLFNVFTNNRGKKNLSKLSVQCKRGVGVATAEGRLERQLEKRADRDLDTWAPVGKKLETSQQRALAAEAVNCILGCSSKAGASRARGVIIPLHQAFVRVHLLQLSVPSFKASKAYSR
ncbi:hypothetical protein QYF61_011869, partial [Mycteria americana]